MKSTPPKRNARRRGRKEDKPAVPPQPLAAETRLGKRRCQYWDRRHENHNDPTSRLIHFQCGQPARSGFETCCYHGSGSAKRERQAIRQNPATASIASGTSARRENVQALLAANPELKERIRYWQDHPELLDLRPVIALCRGLLNHFVASADLNKTEMMKGTAPPILRAISAARKLVEISDRLVAIEGKTGQLPRREFERWKHAVGAGLAKFVPADQLDDCKRYCERLLAEHREPMPGRGPAGRV